MCALALVVLKVYPIISICVKWYKFFHIFKYPTKNVELSEKIAHSSSSFKRNISGNVSENHPKTELPPPYQKSFTRNTRKNEHPE